MNKATINTRYCRVGSQQPNPEGPSTQYLRTLVLKTIPRGSESLNLGYLGTLSAGYPYLHLYLYPL